MGRTWGSKRGNRLSFAAKRTTKANYWTTQLQTARYNATLSHGVRCVLAHYIPWCSIPLRRLSYRRIAGKGRRNFFARGLLYQPETPIEKASGCNTQMSSNPANKWPWDTWEHLAWVRMSTYEQTEKRHHWTSLYDNSTEFYKPCKTCKVCFLLCPM